MIVLIQGLPSGTLVLDAVPSDTSAALKQQIQDRVCLPVCQQILIHNGRQLKDDVSCSDSGVTCNSTVHLTFRLRGGKGGFGALLRGQGRDGKLTTNFDACRDLQGRRLRHVNAEQRLTDWQSQAKERELEKIALQHIKEQAKAAKKEEEATVDIEEVRQAQRQAVDKVRSAVEEALASAPSSGAGTKTDLQNSKKPKNAEGKSLLFGLEGLADGSDVSDSDSDDDSDLTIAGLPQKGKRKAVIESNPPVVKKPKPDGNSGASGSSQEGESD